MRGYIKYYGLSANPFDISPDPRFFFPTEGHKEALASMLYVINERKGFMLVVGENGIGKTILINHLIKSLDEKVKVVSISQGKISFDQMLKEILVKLELPLGRRVKGTMLHQLNEYLIQNLARGENLVLIIDEAHDISMKIMEELRLISNLETSTSKLLQIIFVGQPELETKLNTEELRQIKQRIGIISRIEPLIPEEAMAYIDHRLRQVGRNVNAVFSPEALSLICKSAGGIPKKMNILCQNALFAGFKRSEKPISVATVREIRDEENLLTGKQTGGTSTGDEQKPRFRFVEEKTWPKKLIYFCLALGCIVLAVFLGKDHLKKIPEILNPKASVKQAAVSGKVRTKAPIAKADTGAVSKAPRVAPSESNQVIGSPSEPAGSSKPGATLAKTEIRYKRVVDIGQGANLSSLIHKNYNQVNTTLMDYVMASNPEITNPNLIVVNQKIRLPEITESSLIVESADESIKVHLGTFASRDEALKYKNFIKITDKEIEIIPRKVSSKEVWFRVMAGPFANKEDCLKRIEALKQRGVLPSLGKIPKI